MVFSWVTVSNNEKSARVVFDQNGDEAVLQLFPSAPIKLPCQRSLWHQSQFHQLLTAKGAPRAVVNASLTGTASCLQVTQWKKENYDVPINPMEIYLNHLDGKHLCGWQTNKSFVWNLIGPDKNQEKSSKAESRFTASGGNGLICKSG